LKSLKLSTTDLEGSLSKVLNPDIGIIDLFCSVKGIKFCYIILFKILNDIDYAAIIIIIFNKNIFFTCDSRSSKFIIKLESFLFSLIFDFLNIL